jgi:hypothetical protein
MGSRSLGRLALLLALGAAPACAVAEERPATAPPVLSLLALGDTGEPPEMWSELDPQTAVAEAMVAADRAAPVDGVVLLGDNFYPEGLKESDVKERLRQNVVRPYCHFLALTPRGEGSLSEACRAPAAARNPVPLFVVLGNHDYKEKESPLLQRKLVPEYIASWRMPRGQAEVHELGEGVSLVLLNSMEVVHGESAQAFARQVARSKGPFRIVAAHHPLADPGHGFDRDYARDVAAALEEAGVPVQLALAGHEHNLQVLETPDLPRLHVVAGSGSDTRELSETGAQRHFASDSLGFARVDLVRDEPGSERLVVTLYEVASPTPLHPNEPVAAARFAVDREGGVTELPVERVDD